MALWIAVIQSLGSNAFSAGETSRFLGPLLEWLFPDSGTELLGQMQFAIRKTAHVVEYGILALLSLRAWRLSYGWPQLATALASVAVVIAVATVDESRQALAIERGGAASDVVLDTFGGILALSLALIGGRFAARWIPSLR